MGNRNWAYPETFVMRVNFKFMIKKETPSRGKNGVSGQGKWGAGQLETEPQKP